MRETKALSSGRDEALARRSAPRTVGTEKSPPLIAVSANAQRDGGVMSMRFLDLESSYFLDSESRDFVDAESPRFLDGESTEFLYWC